MSEVNKNFNILFNPRALFGIGISVIGVFFAFKGFDINGFFKTLELVQYEYIILACILIIASVWLRAIRWNFLFKKDDGVDNYSLFQYELIGYFGNNVLPLRLGEILRAYMVGKHFNIPKSYAFGTIILERILDSFALFFISILLLIIYPLTDTVKNYIYIGMLISFILVIALFLLKKNHITNDKSFILSVVVSFLNGFKNIEFKKIPILFFLSIATWLVYWLDVHLIQMAFGFEMSKYHSLLLLVVSTLFMSIPSAPGMIGTFHFGVKYVMVDLLGSHYDLSLNQVTSFAVILHAYGYISYTVLGAIYFVKSQFNKNVIYKVIKNEQ